MSEEYRRLSKRCEASMYTGYAVLMAVMLAVYLPVYLFAGDFWCRHEILTLWQVLLIVLLAYCLLAPPVFYRHYRYILDGKQIDVTRGVFFLRRTVVPVERIMQVEVVRGPINRIWRLADVHITTAGGTATIQYLDPAEADRIAADLGAVVDRLLKERRGA